ncbi:MAG: universal stress protein, partial [Pseudonocardia sp.]|nr:universal stress protein [Pseudonocardia sp.]
HLTDDGGGGAGHRSAMSAVAGRAPVVVGIDGAGSAGDAVDWATAEAAARGCPLYVVHAFRPPLPADCYGLVPPIDDAFTARTAAETVLSEAVARARSVASDVEVSALLLWGTPNRTLLDEAADAQLLVLGSRGLCGARSLLTKSVSVQVAAHASCPVVVIRPARGDGAPGWSPLRVVVGADPTPACAPAIRFAFQAARQRGIPLAAVHAWTPDTPAGSTPVAASTTMAEALARRALARALAPLRSEFADVPVVTTLVPGDPADVLVAESRGAALVVVGSRGRGQVLGTMFGSVSQSVLHHGHSPVAIVRNDPAVPPVTERDPASGHDRSPGPGWWSR